MRRVAVHILGHFSYSCLPHFEKKTSSTVPTRDANETLHFSAALWICFYDWMESSGVFIQRSSGLSSSSKCSIFLRDCRFILGANYHDRYKMRSEGLRERTRLREYKLCHQFPVLISTIVTHPSILVVGCDLRERNVVQRIAVRSKVTLANFPFTFLLTLGSSSNREVVLITRGRHSGPSCVKTIGT